MKVVSEFSHYTIHRILTFPFRWNHQIDQEKLPTLSSNGKRSTEISQCTALASLLWDVSAAGDFLAEIHRAEQFVAGVNADDAWADIIHHILSSNGEKVEFLVLNLLNASDEASPSADEKIQLRLKRAKNKNFNLPLTSAEVAEAVFS